MTQRNPWRVFIIHGFDASPEEHWFPWLEAQLQERGIQAIRLRMPDSSHPDFDRWQATMREAIGQPDEHTILVAHSLGTISVLHFASQSGAKRLGGIVLVSGFAGRIAGPASRHQHQRLCGAAGRERAAGAAPGRHGAPGAGRRPLPGPRGFHRAAGGAAGGGGCRSGRRGVGEVGGKGRAVRYETQWTV